MSNYNCSCVNDYYGSNCEYIRDKNTNSTILSEIKMKELKSLVNLPNNKTLKMIYQSSTDGFDKFHSKCDGFLRTLIVMKAVNSSNIFGGYTEADWSSSYSFKFDTNSYLFILINSNKAPLRMNINKPGNAIATCPSYGPIFGAGDLNCS